MARGFIHWGETTRTSKVPERYKARGKQLGTVSIVRGLAALEVWGGGWARNAERDLYRAISKGASKKDKEENTINRNLIRNWGGGGGKNRENGERNTDTLLTSQAARTKNVHERKKLKVRKYPVGRGQGNYFKEAHSSK